jgi:FixJ family two-component response regulator
MAVRSYVAVIDDDESICRSLGRLLQGAGLSPISYRSAEDFLDDRMRVPFDCLIVDVQLEGMSGVELSRRLAACQIRTPIIYITAHDDPKVREDALDAGAIAFFRKTDSGDEILAAIRRAISSNRVVEPRRPATTPTSLG